MTIGAVFAFAAYLGQLLGPAARLLNVHVDVSGRPPCCGASSRCWTLSRAGGAPGAPALAPIEGRIALRGVSFSYAADQPRALHDVSFEALPGSSLALVGRSGAGKSTLTALLSRLADPDEGVVAIDGIDVRTVSSSAVDMVSRIARRCGACQCAFGTFTDGWCERAPARGANLADLARSVRGRESKFSAVTACPSWRRKFACVGATARARVAHPPPRPVGVVGPGRWTDAARHSTTLREPRSLALRELSPESPSEVSPG